GRDRRLSLDDIRQAEVHPAKVDRHTFDFAITALALGDFIADEAHRTEIALLADDGAIHVLEKAGARSQKSGARSQESGARSQNSGAKADRWQVRQLSAGRWPLATGLVRANVSSLPSDDLLVMDQADDQLHILTPSLVDRESNHESRITNHEARTTNHEPGSTIHGSRITSVVAVLPMRLNRDGLNDLVILRDGSSAPAVVLSMPMATFTVTNTADRGAGSLRQAIFDANANPGADLIVFNITPAGAKTISPPTKLPTITSPVTIDGTTQPGFSGSPVIELDGAGAGVVSSGLLITAGSSVVRGLVINRFGSNGIVIEANGGNLIEGNFIGTNLTGTADLGNSNDGVRIFGVPTNTIGGTTTTARNIISGNNSDGVEINGRASFSNQVQGNFIGTNVTGTARLDNAGHGVRIFGATNNTIGGTTAGARNVISGNNEDGVHIFGLSATSNRVQGNFIGTDSSGTARLDNFRDGVFILEARNNTIGGTTTSARNVISGNNDNGVRIFTNSASGNLVQGNFIGTDAGGTTDVGNSFRGVIIFHAPNNTIGGIAVDAGNTIAFNDQGGVFMFGSAATGNTIRGNLIHSNGGLGIDLDPAGVTLNDACDGDTGPNRLQNFPLLLSASSMGRTTTITGTLNSTANRAFILEFFAVNTCDPSGHGEGQTFLGSAAVTTDGSCNATFTVRLPFALTVGQNITATATDNTTNDTSEFSACVGVTVPANQPPNAVDAQLRRRGIRR
ncbi:MAG: right-handed parallel beta-helix repeat-containing protein, partial [Acidobacteriota bacterium]|nr:right-handed parallel beta-helix repeat-containing protein [Acidobacteriota bacterium]